MSDSGGNLRSHRTLSVVLLIALLATVLLNPANAQRRPIDSIQILIDAGAYDSALTIVDQKLTEDSSRSFLWLQRDTILAAAGETEERIASCERAIALWPGSTVFRLRLAEILIGQQRLEEAGRHVREVLDLTDGEDLRGHYLAGRVYELEGKFDSAIVAYRRAWALLYPDAAETE